MRARTDKNYKVIFDLTSFDFYLVISKYLC